MRRTDREIKDINEIVDILNKGNVIRVSMFNDVYPYIVPLSYGFEQIEDKIYIYIHSANEGLKLDLIRNNPNVAVETDEFIKTERIKHGITSRYRSVIAFGNALILDNDEEKKHGLRLIVDHYGYNDFNLDICNNFSFTTVVRIEVKEIFGKKNLPNE